MAMICHMNYYWQQDKTKLRNAFNNNISTIIQSGGFLGSLLSKVVRPLMKVATPSAKNVLAPLGIIAATSAIDAGIQKKTNQKNMVLEQNFKNFKWRNEWYNENCSGPWRLKGVTKTIKMKQKNKKVDF